MSLDFSESQSASPTLIERSTEPVIAISAKSDRIQEGQNAELRVTSSIATFANVQIAITETGDFIVKNIPEFVQFNGNLDFNLSIPTQDDQIAEDDGAVIVSIAEGEGYSIANSPSNQAAVLISDANDRNQYNEKLSAANRILIPELMATTGVQSYQTMSNRVQMAFNNEEQFLYEIGGQSNPTKILQLSGQSLNEQSDLMDLLRDDTDIAFKLTSDNAILNNTTAWLKSENQNVYNLNNSDSTAWSGDFYTGNFGIDTQLNSGLLLGIATSISEHEIHLSTEQVQEFQYTASYTGFNPYIALNSPIFNTEVWVSSNFSSGYIDVDSDNQQTHRLDTQYSTMTFGAKSQLLSHDNAILNGTSEVKLSGQGWLAQQSIFGDGRFTSDLKTEGHHLQVSLTGYHEIDIAKIGTFNPNMLIGIRQAKKDDNSVAGLEFGLGAQYFSSFGVSLEGFGRGFKGLEQQNYATNFSGELTYNPNHDNNGSQFTISPSWGQTAGITQLSLWQSNLASENDLFNHYADGVQVNTEYSYGFNLFDGIGTLTPFSAMDFSRSDSITYNIGNRIEIGTDTRFEIKGIREVRNNNITNSKLQLQGIVRW